MRYRTAQLGSLNKTLDLLASALRGSPEVVQGASVNAGVSVTEVESLAKERELLDSVQGRLETPVPRPVPDNMSAGDFFAGLPFDKAIAKAGTPGAVAQPDEEETFSGEVGEGAGVFFANLPYDRKPHSRDHGGGAVNEAPESRPAVQEKSIEERAGHFFASLPWEDRVTTAASMEEFSDLATKSALQAARKESPANEAQSGRKTALPG